MRRAQRRKYHFIYKTTNLINNKFYVGMHSTDNLEDGYLGSGKILWYSLNKYGREYHKIERLEFFETREKLKSRERELVNEELLKDPLCMNLHKGGDGGWSREQQRKNGKKGNEKMKWLRENDEEWKQNLSKARSEGNKRSYKNGRIVKIPNWTGKKHKEETKQKIGKANSISQKGQRNSQFETKWITNNTINKKIHKSQKIPDGWKYGRIIKYKNNEWDD